jgi:hypothetical protein
MRRYAALFIIILLAFLPSCKYFKGKKLFHRKADTMLVWQARQDSIRVADSIKKVQDRLQAVENARLDSIRLAEEAKAALASKYNIIVGSFITPEYAKAWAEEYRRRGYDSKIIKMENSRFELVIAESHESLRKAVSRLNQFQDTIQVDAWIYKKK